MLTLAALLGGVFAVAPATPESRWSASGKWEQVRGRVIVRISPFGAAGPRAAPDAQQAIPLRRAKGGEEECLPIASVAGVRLDGAGRLLVFMRDQRIYSADFERSCQVQGFYSGFYVERPSDGMLCAGREELHARSGADCTLGSFSELVAED